MNKLTQKQLIDSLDQLKGIKPRKEWAVLLKSQILAEKKSGYNTIKNPAEFAGFQNIFATAFQRKLAYAFAAILILVFGSLESAKLLPIGNKSSQETASLIGQTKINQNTVALNNLAQAIKNQTTTNSLAIKDISAKAKVLAQSLKNNPTKDPETLKSIATSLKTLADMPGTDLSANQDVQNLYQTVVESQIADLQKTTLTDDQKNILAQAENLYSQGKYSDALETIWTITNNINNNSTNSTNLIDTTSPTK